MVDGLLSDLSAADSMRPCPKWRTSRLCSDTFIRGQVRFTEGSQPDRSRWRMSRADIRNLRINRE